MLDQEEGDFYLYMMIVGGILVLIHLIVAFYCWCCLGCYCCRKKIEEESDDQKISTAGKCKPSDQITEE